MDYFGQGAFGVRLAWGPAGAQACAADVSVVVDVLSFSTSVSVATERGMKVYPYPWNDDRATAFAAERDAVLAVGRLKAAQTAAVRAPSLSPAGLLRSHPVPRLVLPSPNGSTIASALNSTGSTVAIGCLRNARAAGFWAVTQLNAGCSVALIAAGERWASDDSLRPALEDHLGVGAIASQLVSAGFASECSPETLAAACLYDATPDLGNTLRNCVSGRELAARGFEEDVDVAAQLDAATGVPLLWESAFSI
ncbi:MAG: 2-phosphosulfolactate phosphatase [Actinomycetota bacterium]|nr:2-phosphosulfolactate phosphatase [Actinomycetota bacterium]